MYEDFFFKRLIELRTQKNVSAREMSLAIGQSSNYINNIENRLAFPSMAAFFYICEYLNITPKDFFDHNDFLDTDSSNILLVLNNLRKLTAKQQKIISILIDELSQEK